MTERKPACGLLAIAVTLALAGAAARAADEPLLVVVEASPALDIDAAEVRRAVGSELHTRTLGPIKAGETSPCRALIVAMDQSRIAMSLRTTDGPPITRAIPTPADRAARLQAIAWLAGNLARDQVSPILAETPVNPVQEPPPPAPPEPPAATEPPPVTPAPVATLPDTPPPDASETPVITRVGDGRPANRSRWTLGASAGPIFAVLQTPAQGAWPPGAAPWPALAWQVEALRRRDDQRVILGAALEGTYGDVFKVYSINVTSQLIGAHAFAGTDWRYRSLALEAAFGLGIEAAQTIKISPYDPLGYYETYQLGVYGQGSLAGTVSVTDSIDIALQLAVHLTPSHDENWFAASMLGVRWRLP